MEIDPITRRLFSPFDREVGNPKRKRIYSLSDFIFFVERNNGIRDCYVSLYAMNGVIDKIFFDLDSDSGLSGCLEDARRLYSWMVDEGYDVIPVLSGKKGFHFYLLLKPMKYPDSKLLLRRATYGILCEVFGTGEGKIKTASVDPHPIGDVRRMVRIPNTLRPPENLTWCTYLPSDWLDMDVLELIEHMKSPHVYDYPLDGKRPTLYDFPEPPVDVTEWRPVGKTTPIRVKGHTILQNVLRPCLYRHLVGDPEPPHVVRVAATIDLLNFFTEEEIFEMYKSLGWRDWDPDITRYQIRSCKGLKPYSCKKLRQLGIPEVCCVG